VEEGWGRQEGKRGRLITWWLWARREKIHHGSDSIVTACGGLGFEQGERERRVGVKGGVGEEGLEVHVSVVGKIMVRRGKPGEGGGVNGGGGRGFLFGCFWALTERKFVGVGGVRWGSL